MRGGVPSKVSSLSGSLFMITCLWNSRPVILKKRGVVGLDGLLKNITNFTIRTSIG